MTPGPSVLLIDALNIIRRIFESATRQPEDGVVPEIVRSSVASIRRALRDNSATHCLVVFEGEGDTWRHALYPPYKQNRKKAPEALVQVTGEVRRKLDALGVSYLQKDGYEADDVIASVASRLGARDLRVTIVSNDKDFLQLLSENIVLRNHFARTGAEAVRDHGWIEEKYGVPCRLFVDAMALVGDPADNIPGVPGIGPKKAGHLLRQWGNLDRLIEKSDWIRGTVGTNLRAAREQLPISRKLLTLKTDLEFGLRLSDIRIPPPLRKTS